MFVPPTRLPRVTAAEGKHLYGLLSLVRDDAATPAAANEAGIRPLKPQKLMNTLFLVWYEPKNPKPEYDIEPSNQPRSGRVNTKNLPKKGPLTPPGRAHSSAYCRSNI